MAFKIKVSTGKSPRHKYGSSKKKRLRRGTSKAGKASGRARRKKSPRFFGSSRRKRY